MTTTFFCKPCNFQYECCHMGTWPVPNPFPCPKCGAAMEKLDVPAKYPLSSGRPSSPAILHGRESAKSPIDVVIGRDAEARWADIHRRQELRDKVRAEGGEVGLTATGRNEFEPISQEQKSKRTEATKQVEREGYKAEYDGTDGEIVR